MSNEFEEFDVNFKIVSNKNEKVYVEGYVTINDEESEDVDWYYWTGTQYQQSPYYHHDEEEITGLTTEQNDEIDKFKVDYMEDAFWIDTSILQSDADENRTYVRENCTLIINEGAKMECEIKERPDIDSYWVAVTPFFNGKRIPIMGYMDEMNIEFDPWNVNDSKSYIEHGKIFFEISKDYWDDDFKEEIIDDVNEEARRIYAMYLTRELGIYAKYGEIMEQSMDDHYEDDWLFKMSQLVNKSDEELDAFLREEGYIDDELDY